MQGPSHCPLHHVPGRAFHVSIWLWGNADTGAQTTKPFYWLQENPFGFHNVNNDTGKETKGILLCFIYKVILTWQKMLLPDTKYYVIWFTSLGNTYASSSWQSMLCLEIRRRQCEKNHQPSCFWQIVHFSVWIEEVK